MAHQHALLSPDERYEVWIVKAAERPDLLKWEEPNGEEDHPHPPLQDGCDIPGWRRARLVDCQVDYITALLRIGPGNPMLRRERQLITLSSHLFEKWSSLRETLRATNICEPPRVSYTPGCVVAYTSPFLLEDCTTGWKACQTMQWESLVRSFGHLDWRFSDEHGEMMRLNTYNTYCQSLEGMLDDAPLAIYDSLFGDDERASLLQDYSVPVCFRNDLLNRIENEEDRPPYRWILMGPARSGTGLHVDPVGTHAWVTLIEGCKRWIFFPPSYTRFKREEPSAVWFQKSWPLERFLAAYEFVQSPGETVFVPAGWPHAVLNLERSVAVTHNFASDCPLFWKVVQSEEPQLYERLCNVQRTSISSPIVQATGT